MLFRSKVIVKPGDVVQQGDVLVILEAMKMETEVCATEAGSVASVQVKAGDTVVVGDPLVIIS